jgi:RNA polymerase sigma-70 factor (ECF subfamily)
MRETALGSVTVIESFHPFQMSDRTASEGVVTGLLRAWGRGDRTALDELIPLVHQQLRQLARRHLARERPGHTIQPTALVNEAYIRLVNQRGMAWRDRSHFLAIAAQLMRYILVDHARRRRYQKRGGSTPPIALDVDVADPRSAGILAIDGALNDLMKIDERKARVVEMRLFGGLSVAESAQLLGVSAETVTRDWRFARAWLQHELRK